MHTSNWNIIVKIFENFFKFLSHHRCVEMENLI